MNEDMNDRRFLGLPVRELEALGLDPRRRIVPLWFGCRAALAAVPSSCPIEISGRSQFKLFINGVSVHFGPCRSAREVAYVDTLDIDLDARTYAHTSDMLYALRAEHNCAFTAKALPKNAAGGTYSDYLVNLAPAYRNAFFSGSAHYTDGVWAGFYVDLSTIEVVSAEGTLELLY